MAGNIYVVGGEKGGTGKSNCVANVAAVLAHEGVTDILIVNTDAQRTIEKWWTDRRSLWKDQLPKLECLTVRGERIDDALLDYAERYRIVLVDAQGSDNIELRMSLTVARRAVFPMSADRADTFCIPELNRMVRVASRANRQLEASVLLYKIKSERRDWARQEMRAQLDALGEDLRMGLCKTVVGSRAAFSDAFYEGLGAIEMKRRNSDATSESIGMTKELVAEIMETSNAA